MPFETITRIQVIFISNQSVVSIDSNAFFNASITNISYVTNITLEILHLKIDFSIN